MKTITAKNFKPYGKVIEYPNKTKKGKGRNLWRIVHTESAKVGWRVAYLVLRDKTLGQMGCHPTTDETFEPIKGRALLFVATSRDLSAIECFKLDQPVIVNKGVWHNVITLTSETEIKIVENANVTSKIWKFGFRVKSFNELKQKIQRVSS